MTVDFLDLNKVVAQRARRGGEKQTPPETKGNVSTNFSMKRRLLVASAVKYTPVG